MKNFKRKFRWLLPRMSSCDKLELLSCVVNGNQQHLREMLASGADPNCKFDDSTSLLHNLAVSDSISEKDRLEAFFLLKEAGAKINYKNSKGITALMFAAGGGHEPLVTALLSSGAQINAKDKNQDTPLIWACSTSKLASLLPLLSAGADINCKGSLRRTALMYAARNGNCTYIKELLNVGADILESNEEKKTPLLLAAETGQTDAVNLILMHAPELASTLSLSLASSVGLLEIVKTRLDSGASTTEVNELGFSPLELAVIYKRKEVVSLLLPAITNYEILARALSLSCLSCNEDILKMMLASGADVNFQDEKGDTALIHAVSRNFSCGVELLLKSGADKKIKNSAGDDVIDIGQSNKSYDALQIIYNYKAN